MNVHISVPGVGGGDNKITGPRTTLSRIAAVTRIATFSLMGLDVVLSLYGFSGWPELTLLSLGLIGVMWALNNFKALRPRSTEDNRFTRAGKKTRAIVALGSPVVAALIVYSPITYAQGAGFLGLLAGASTVLLALGKALDLKALLAGLAVSAAIFTAAYALPEPPRTTPRRTFEHDIDTDAKLKITLVTPDGQERSADGIGFSCFAILPKTWFTARPLVFVGSAIININGEREADLPYSPLGYVVEAHEDESSIGKPGFAEAEVTGVLPGQTREVRISAPRR